MPIYSDRSFSGYSAYLYAAKAVPPPVRALGHQVKGGLCLSLKQPPKFTFSTEHKYPRHCQLKSDLADWTYGANSLIPDKSMNYNPVNCLFSVQFSLS